MKTIPLTQGQVALVDDADYEAVSQFKWHARKAEWQFYAVRTIPKAFGFASGHFQLLHQFLMPGVAEIDHIDGNGLNNQRYNLRSVTHRQNMQGHRRKRIGATSRYRGVSWHARDRKWQAVITVNGGYKYLGSFDSETDAARARDAATLKYFGPDAHFNFPL